MINEDNLKDHGYKQSNTASLDQDSEIFASAWYKVISDETSSNIYQITITKYDQSKGSHWATMTNNIGSTAVREEIRISYSPFVQFILPNGDRFDVTYLNSKSSTIDDIEKFFTRIYRSMECIPT
jgi:hypothetical protein